mgnify:FL=1
MPVTINGDGSIAGLAVGGLGNGGIVDADSLAANAVTTAKIANSAVTIAKTSNVSGLIPITSTTLTSEDTNVALTNAFTDYRQYVVIIDKISCTQQNKDVEILLRNSSGDITSSDYKCLTSGVGSDHTFSGLSFFRINYNSVGYDTSGSYVLQDFSAVLYFSGFEANRRCRYHGTTSYQSSDNTVRGQMVQGVLEKSDAITAINFRFQSGSIRAGGKFSLFGVNI